MKRGTTFFLKTTVFLYWNYDTSFVSVFLALVSELYRVHVSRICLFAISSFNRDVCNSNPIFLCSISSSKTLKLYCHGKAFNRSIFRGIKFYKILCNFNQWIICDRDYFSYFAKLPPPKCSNYRIYNYIYFCCYCGFCSGSSKVIQKALVIKSENDLTV